LPNLRYLEATSFPDDLDPRLLLQFKNLTALEISYDERFLDFLAEIGPKMKELKFNGYVGDETETKNNLLKIFALCPNLESFEFVDFADAVNLEVPVVVENLKLKKVCLEGYFKTLKDSCLSS